MGSLVSGITGLFSGGSSGAGNTSNNASSVSALQGVAGQQQLLSGQLAGQGGSIYGPAFNQNTAGASDQLLPAQQSLVTENLGTMNTNTAGLYGDLGLGGSTMEGQDTSANALRSMSERANLDFQNQQMGLQGLQEALGYYGAAGQNLGGAGATNQAAGGLQDFNTAQLNSAINSLGNKSAGGLGSGISSIGSGIGGLLGLGGGSAAGGAVDTGLIDAGAGAIGGDAAIGAAGAGAADAAAGGVVTDLLPLLALA